MGLENSRFLCIKRSVSLPMKIRECQVHLPAIEFSLPRQAVSRTSVRHSRDVIEKYNSEDAIRRGVVFIPVGWELTLGGLGRPQAIINQDLEECDAFVLVLHDRWGSILDLLKGIRLVLRKNTHTPCNIARMRVGL